MTTKWEYMVLRIHNFSEVIAINGIATEKIVEDSVGLLGNRNKKERSPYLFEFLPEVGKQGWEVCSTLPETFEDRNVWWDVILKRPLEE